MCVSVCVNVSRNRRHVALNVGMLLQIHLENVTDHLNVFLVHLKSVTDHVNAFFYFTGTIVDHLKVCQYGRQNQFIAMQGLHSRLHCQGLRKVPEINITHHSKFTNHKKVSQ